MPNIGNCNTALRKYYLPTADWALLSGSAINITPSSYHNLDYISYCNSIGAEAYNMTQITTGIRLGLWHQQQVFPPNFFDTIGGFNAGSFVDDSLTGIIESETTGPSDL